jgi:Domain of unknown function (DUF4386)
MENTRPMSEGKNKKMAAIAGWSLIAMAILAGFAYGYAFQQTYVPDDAIATLENLKNGAVLLRLCIFTFFLVLILDVVVAWALYFFFESHHKIGVLLMACLRLVYAALLGASLMNLVSVISILDDSTEQISTFFEQFLDSWSAGLIVFAVHLFALGRLMWQHSVIPKLISGLTLLAAFFFFLVHSAALLWPGFDQIQSQVEAILSLPMALGELGLAGYLIWFSKRQ